MKNANRQRNVVNFDATAQRNVDKVNYVNPKANVDRKEIREKKENFDRKETVDMKEKSDKEEKSENANLIRSMDTVDNKVAYEEQARLQEHIGRI